MKLAQLAQLTRQYLEQEYPQVEIKAPPPPQSSTPETPILILHGDEPAEELALLERMAGALTDRVAPTTVKRSDGAPPPAKLLVATQRAGLKPAPGLLLLPPLRHFLDKPHTRKLLWQQLVERYNLT